MDIERRITPSQTAVEYRCACEKTGQKKPVIVGYAAVFNSESRNLGGFVETIHPNAFDAVLGDKPDVIGVFNHDRNKLLGRTSNDSLRLTTDAYGLRYEITPPDTQEARDVVELVRGGYVAGSSFAFSVKRDGGDAWSSDTKGLRRREIRQVGLLEDVGPVVRPAYNASSVVVSRRALEIAVGESFRPNQTMANASKRGLKQVGKSEKDDQMLVGIAERVANREILTFEEVAYLAGVHQKCAEQRHSGWNGSPAWVEWQLAGGDSGQKWIERRNEDSAALVLAPVDHNEAAAVESRAEEAEEVEAEPSDGSLTAGNYDLYEALEDIAEENGKWPQEGPGGAHYMAESAFRGSGIACTNCVFFNEGGSCDIVEGVIQPEGVCKLWIIPEEKLSMHDAQKPKEEPVAKPQEPAPAQRSDVDTIAAIAKLKALALGAAANGIRK